MKGLHRIFVRCSRAKTILLLFLFLCGAGGPKVVWGASKNLRAAYEDGWKWYLHRKSQGAPQEELVDILQTLKQKYGKKFKMTNVNKALDTLGVEPPAPARSPGKRTGAVPKPAASTPPAPRKPRPVPITLVPSKPLPQDNMVEASQLPPPDSPARKALIKKRLKELTDQGEAVRSQAARELGELKAREAIEALTNMLGDESTYVAMVAANSLAKIGRSALIPLRNAMRHKNFQVRVGACVAMGNLELADAVPDLKKAAQDKDERVRTAAVAALNRIQYVLETSPRR